MIFYKDPVNNIYFGHQSNIEEYIVRVEDLGNLNHILPETALDLPDIKYDSLNVEDSFPTSTLLGAFSAFLRRQEVEDPDYRVEVVGPRVRLSYMGDRVIESCLQSDGEAIITFGNQQAFTSNLTRLLLWYFDKQCTDSHTHTVYMQFTIDSYRYLLTPDNSGLTTLGSNRIISLYNKTSQV